jgi:hypothetical protein
VVPFPKGKALANEYGIKFFETVSNVYLKILKHPWVFFLLLQTEDFLSQSAKTNRNVNEAFFSIARDIKQRLPDIDSTKTVFELSVPWIHGLVDCVNS